MAGYFGLLLRITPSLHYSTSALWDKKLIQLDFASV